MGYVRYTVPDAVAIEHTLLLSLALADMCPWPLVTFLWRTVNSKLPTIPFGILASTFPDNLSRNSCIYYCNLALGCTYKSNLKSIVILRKRAFRLVSNSTYAAYTDPIFKEQILLKCQDINLLPPCKTNTGWFPVYFQGPKFYNSLNARITESFLLCIFFFLKCLKNFFLIGINVILLSALVTFVFVKLVLLLLVHIVILDSLIFSSEETWFFINPVFSFRFSRHLLPLTFFYNTPLL